ncbi:hypothetical protein OO013_15625 [Mangrovivirga sp. M17]|uniref:Uncharacterized protein n=1 Tax=Mangrovivirga halotolerans TaxID=2993936 RepID=A0ABT3RU45_9BACT|nr:hypothetical protein [Mangrovivirga halotolerans]MCX2745307.1 hypothetical protein [Mangrovivirga halotolerans]
MKHLITAILISGLLFSCNSSSESETETEDTTSVDMVSEKLTSDTDKQFKPIETEEALIATSLMAAPKDSRSGCKVIGYNMEGEFVTFREGENEFIVLADNPNKEGFNAACYHKDLEPFMARGRELRAEGKTRDEIFEIRGEEMESGKLKITPGLTLHIYYGPNETYNPETYEVEDARLRYVVYMPYATQESTGLPKSPSAPNHPWIMEPGTHRAHIMISPLSKDDK